MAIRKLVTIQKINDLQPIPGADVIEKAKIREWWVVVKKGEFQVGSHCIYFEIDSFLPVKPEYEFLLRGSSPKKMLIDGQEKLGIRLKTIRLRGQISQGLALPTQDGREVGTDVSEELNVVKYEPPIPAELAGVVKGPFPSFIPKTDEERIQNCSDVLEKNKGEVCYVTSKLDGTSATFYRYNGEFGVCSRNLELKETLGNTLWGIAEKYKLREVIHDGCVIQGEVVGEGINKNPLKLQGHRLFVFNVFNILEYSYLDFAQLVKFVGNAGLEMVPILDDNFVLNHTCEDLLKLASQKSPLNSHVNQEGIVIRPKIEKRTMINGVDARFSFKAVSNEYLLEAEK